MRLVLCFILLHLTSCASNPAKPLGVHRIPAGSEEIPSPPGELFSSYEPLPLMTMTAPFLELWKHRAPPNSVVDKATKDFSVEGEIETPDHQGNKKIVKVTVKLRGNTSQLESECAFPKMKIEIDKESAAGTVFEGTRVVGIGTHCGESGGRSSYGRDLSGLSPYREVIAYRILDTLGIVSYRARPALFNYVETSTGKAPTDPVTQKEVSPERQAFFLEDSSAFEKRAGANEIKAEDARIDPNDPPNTGPKFTDAAHAPGMSMTEVAEIYLAAALIGNQDWKLKVSPDDSVSHDLWNIKVFEIGGKWHPFTYDFDLSEIVIGADYGTFNRMTTQMGGIAELKPVLKDAASPFSGKKAKFLGFAKDLGKDSVGAARLKANISTFYKGLPALLKGST